MNRRVALVLMLAGGCLSAPTGLDPAAIDASTTIWPPPGADITSIASGDVDGDGKDDLVVVDVGNGRVHFLRGGGDLDPTRSTVTTATASAAIAGLRAPTAAIITRVESARFIVVLDSPTAGPRLSVFDMQLRPTGTTTIGGVATPTSSDVVTLNRSTFGMGASATLVTFPTSVAFVEGASLDDATPSVMMVPAAGATFSGLLGATGYVVLGAPAVPRLVVTSATLTQTGDAPTQGVFTWSPVRSGSTWTAQAFAEVTGDAFPDLIGFSPNGGAAASLCIFDVQTGTNPPCYTTPFGMDNAQLAVGSVAGVDQDDVVLLDAPPGGSGMANLFAVPRLRIVGNAVTADGTGSPLMINLTAPRLALAQLDSGPVEILAMGRDGRVVCARVTGPTPSLCAP